MDAYMPHQEEHLAEEVDTLVSTAAQDKQRDTVAAVARAPATGQGFGRNHPAAAASHASLSDSHQCLYMLDYAFGVL
jgi:hypothetical protein